MPFNGELKKSLKLAVAVDCRRISQWQQDVLLQVLRRLNAKIQIVLLPWNPPQVNWAGRVFKKFLLRKSFYLRETSEDIFASAAYINCSSTQDSNAFAAEILKQHSIDAILSLSEENFALQFVDCCHLGILRYEFGESPSFYHWATTERIQPVLLAHYRVNKSTLEKTYLKSGRVRRYFESLATHADGTLQSVLPWMAQGLDSLSSTSDATSSYNKVLHTEDPNILWSWRFFQQMGFLTKAFFRKTRRLFLFQNWNIALVHEPITTLLKNDKVLERRWLPNRPKSGFIADPFPILYKGKLKIFVERFDFKTGKGVVEALSLDRAPENQSMEAIELPTHMSYPSMVVHENNLYCIPETLGENEVSIYQCLQFPNRWKKVTTLLADQMLSDPNLFEHNGKWWLFASRYNRFSGGNDQLCAWSAESFLGPWRPHKNNPLKVDVGSARSAGAPFTVDGVLYRPSQDCSKAYGGAVVINRVIKLTEENFIEEEVARWLPDDVYKEGCHHVAGYGDITIIDGRTEEFSWRAPIVKIAQLLRKRKRAPLPSEQHLALSEDSSTETSNKETLNKFKTQTSW